MLSNSVELAAALFAPVKRSKRASMVEALSMASSEERALLQRPQLELMHEVQIGFEKPEMQLLMHALTPQLKPVPRQEAHEGRTPLPTRQLDTQVTLPAPGTPRQRPPQLCSTGLLSKRQCPYAWKTKTLKRTA